MTGPEPSTPYGAGGFYVGVPTYAAPSRSWNRQRLACVQTDMTEDEREQIAELHFAGDPAVLAELRRDREISRLLDSLDLVVWELDLLRNTI